MACGGCFAGLGGSKASDKDVVRQLQSLEAQIKGMDQNLQKLQCQLISPPNGKDSPTSPTSPATTRCPEGSVTTKSTTRSITFSLYADEAKVDMAVLKAEEERQRDFRMVFSWLNWGPPVDSPCFRSLRTHFPGALPGRAVHQRVRQALEDSRFGFTPENTLFGTSICPDEINNEKEKGDLATVMADFWGEVFPLGGIGGAPYVGKTGFGAFSHHVPDDGHVLVLFGPHVAVSDAGEIGKYLREGQKCHSTACGAVIGAYNACCSGDDISRIDPEDLEMWWIKEQLKPHCERLQKAPEPLAALAYQAYEAVKTKMLAVVNNNFGTGNLVLVGGIQINMPSPYEDHFLPLMFQATQAGRPGTIDLLEEFSVGLPTSPVSRGASVQNRVFNWLSWAPALKSPCYRTLDRHFPGALPGNALHSRLRAVLESEEFGLDPDNTLFGTSICPDEINAEKGDLPDVMKNYWGECFPMGGISGAPFVGKTGFGAFANHVPDDGHVLLLYGPHVGISEDGEVGKCFRPGQCNKSSACGAVVGAYGACCKHLESKGEPMKEDDNDLQMDWIKRQVFPHVARVQRQENPMASLARISYDFVAAKVDQVVNNDFGSGYLVLVGGIMINMPYPCDDHFLPLRFEVRRKGEATRDLMPRLSMPVQRLSF